MRIQRTYYEVMGLPRTATSQEIKAKYHDLARQYHPDRAADKSLAERLFVQVNLAYRTLMDPDKRAVYDASLFQADAAMVGAQAPGSASAAPAGGQQTGAAASRPAAPPPRPQMNLAEAMNRANTAYMGGDRITAHKLCMEILRVDSRNTEAHSLVGDIYADQGRRQEALAEYRAAADAGDSSRLLQEKIKRMETLVNQPANPAAAQTAQPPPTAQRPNPPAPQSRPTSTAQPEPKKGGLFDRLIGRRS